MKKIWKQAIFLIVLIAILILPYFVFAQAPQDSSGPLKRLENMQPNTGYAQATNTSVSTIVGQVITAILSLLGVVFLGLMVYGGYIWMIDRGNSEQVEKSKKIIQAAIIGLIIVVAAYAITQFVYGYVIERSGALQ